MSGWLEFQLEHHLQARLSDDFKGSTISDSDSDSGLIFPFELGDSDVAVDAPNRDTASTGRFDTGFGLDPPVGVAAAATVSHGGSAPDIFAMASDAVNVMYARHEGLASGLRSASAPTAVSPLSTPTLMPPPEASSSWRQGLGRHPSAGHAPLLAVQPPTPGTSFAPLAGGLAAFVGVDGNSHVSHTPASGLPEPHYHAPFGRLLREIPSIRGLDPNDGEPTAEQVQLFHDAVPLFAQTGQHEGVRPPFAGSQADAFRPSNMAAPQSLMQALARPLVATASPSPQSQERQQPQQATGEQGQASPKVQHPRQPEQVSEQQIAQPQAPDTQQFTRNFNGAELTPSGPALSSPLSSGEREQTPRSQADGSSDGGNQPHDEDLASAPSSASPSSGSQTSSSFSTPATRHDRSESSTAAATPSPSSPTAAATLPASSSTAARAKPAARKASRARRARSPTPPLFETAHRAFLRFYMSLPEIKSFHKLRKIVQNEESLQPQRALPLPAPASLAPAPLNPGAGSVVLVEPTPAIGVPAFSTPSSSLAHATGSHPSVTVGTVSPASQLLTSIASSSSATWPAAKRTAGGQGANAAPAVRSPATLNNPILAVNAQATATSAFTAFTASTDAAGSAAPDFFPARANAHRGQGESGAGPVFPARVLHHSEVMTDLRAPPALAPGGPAAPVPPVWPSAPWGPQMPATPASSAASAGSFSTHTWPAHQQARLPGHPMPAEGFGLPGINSPWYPPPGPAQAATVAMAPSVPAASSLLAKGKGKRMGTLLESPTGKGKSPEWRMPQAQLAGGSSSAAAAALGAKPPHATCDDDCIMLDGPPGPPSSASRSSPFLHLVSPSSSSSLSSPQSRQPGQLERPARPPYPAQPIPVPRPLPAGPAGPAYYAGGAQPAQVAAPLLPARHPEPRGLAEPAQPGWAAAPAPAARAPAAPARPAPSQQPRQRRKPRASARQAQRRDQQAPRGSPPPPAWATQPPLPQQAQPSQQDPRLGLHVHLYDPPSALQAPPPPLPPPPQHRPPHVPQHSQPPQYLYPPYPSQPAHPAQPLSPQLYYLPHPPQLFPLTAPLPPIPDATTQYGWLDPSGQPNRPNQLTQPAWPSQPEQFVPWAPAARLGELGQFAQPMPDAWIPGYGFGQPGQPGPGPQGWLAQPQHEGQPVRRDQNSVYPALGQQGQPPIGRQAGQPAHSQNAAAADPAVLAQMAQMAQMAQFAQFTQFAQMAEMAQMARMTQAEQLAPQSAQATQSGQEAHVSLPTMNPTSASFVPSNHTQGSFDSDSLWIPNIPDTRS